MASSMRPLYSAALGVSELSGFFGAVFSGAGSAGFGSVLVSDAPVAASFEAWGALVVGELAAELSGVVPVALVVEVGDGLSLAWELCSARAASKTGFILFAPYTITPRSNNAARIVPKTLFFFGRSTGSAWGAIVPVRRTTGVWLGEAARALRERAVAITVGSFSEEPWLANPRPPPLPVAMVAAGEGPPIIIVELGFPPAM